MHAHMDGCTHIKLGSSIVVLLVVPSYPRAVMAPASSRIARKSRPITSYFEPAALVEKWKHFANKQDQNFNWDGTGYGKPSRNTGADKEGLLVFKILLKELLALAPSGFPCFAKLRMAIWLLDEKYKILGGLESKQSWKASGEAANVCRIMCRDVYDLVKKRNRCVR